MTDIIYREEFAVARGDFAHAGEASRSMKRTLKKMGVNPSIVREVSIASYELELNLVIHSLGGELILEFEKDMLRLISRDHGPGIPEISLAMQEGYSTASDDVRNLGFGAGMGLPNVKTHSHDFYIESKVPDGTLIKYSHIRTEDSLV